MVGELVGEDTEAAVGVASGPRFPFSALILIGPAARRAGYVCRPPVRHRRNNPDRPGREKIAWRVLLRFEKWLLFALQSIALNTPRMVGAKERSLRVFDGGLR